MIVYLLYFCNCASAAEPILNKAQPAAIARGAMTTIILQSTILFSP